MNIEFTELMELMGKAAVMGYGLALIAGMLSWGITMAIRLFNRITKPN